MGKLNVKNFNEKLELFIIDNFVWFICVVLYVFFSILAPKGFVNFSNIEHILNYSAPLGFLVLGVALLLISGNLDLSLADIAGLAAMSTSIAWLLPGVPGWVAIVVVFLVGAACGAINGFLVGKLKFNPFLATLGTFLIFDWLTFMISRGTISNVPKVLLIPGSFKIGGIHIAIVIFFFSALIVSFVMTKTQYGVKIYAIGGNDSTTKMMGLNNTAIIFWIYFTAGIFAGMSGLITIGYIGVVTSTISQNMIFLAFAGAIIGGISLQGGSGRISGAVGGVIMLGILETGLTMMRVSPEIRGVLKGVVLIVAIEINMTMAKLRDRILLPEK